MMMMHFIEIINILDKNVKEKKLYCALLTESCSLFVFVPIHRICCFSAILFHYIVFLLPIKYRVWNHVRNPSSVFLPCMSVTEHGRFFFQSILSTFQSCTNLLVHTCISLGVNDIAWGFSAYRLILLVWFYIRSRWSWKRT